MKVHVVHAKERKNETQILALSAQTEGIVPSPSCPA